MHISTISSSINPEIAHIHPHIQGTIVAHAGAKDSLSPSHQRLICLNRLCWRMHPMAGSVHPGMKDDKNRCKSVGRLKYSFVYLGIETGDLPVIES